MKYIILASLVLLFKFATVSAQVKCGVDVLIENNFAELKGKKVGLFTNQSGRTNKGRLTAELFASQKSFELVAFYTPEHGLYGDVPAGEKIANDSIFGIKVFSLYGSSREPAPWMLKRCDVIVIDIQDIGLRSYTFISSVYNILKVCADISMPVIILDRPNPLGGLIVDGNVLEAGRESFVGIIPIAYVHGCTMGELAQMMNEEGWLGKNIKGETRHAEISIIKIKNWKRNMAWEADDLFWFPTSPHVPTVDAVRGAAALGTFGELGFISIGIGTTLPFQYTGGTNFDADAVLRELQVYDFDGMSFFKAKYRPLYAKHANNSCEGIILQFRSKEIFKPYTGGIKLMLAIRKIYPDLFNPSKIDKKAKDMFIKVTGTDKIFTSIFGGDDDAMVLQAAEAGLYDYLNIRKKYLLYD